MIGKVRWNLNENHHKVARYYLNEIKEFDKKNIKINATTRLHTVDIHYEILKKDKFGFWKRRLSKLLVGVNKHLVPGCYAVAQVNGNFKDSRGLFTHKGRLIGNEKRNEKLVIDPSVIGAKISITNNLSKLNIPTDIRYLESL